jgi:2,4-dienoyl-CoA reductase-like NADH-dependent reductase (Old Yellow Enzyme family)
MKETSDEIHQLDLSHDKVIFGLNVLREKCERYKRAPVRSDQLRGEKRVYPGSVHYARLPSRRSASWKGPRPRAGRRSRATKIDDAKLRELIDGYVGAARRLKRAGFKILMVHCAHNNLIGQFFSPISNYRTDRYGGSLENRARFGLEVLEGIRREVGPDMVIDARMSGEDVMPGGLTVVEAVEIAKMMEPYVDIFTISCAFHNAPSYIADKMSLSMYYPADASARVHEEFPGGAEKLKAHVHNERH